MSFRLELENELSLSLPVRRLEGTRICSDKGEVRPQSTRLLFLCSLSGGLGHQNGTLVIKFIPNIILALTIYLVVSADTYGTAVPVLRGMERYM